MIGIKSVSVSGAFPLVTGSIDNIGPQDELCTPVAFSIVGHERTYSADIPSSICDQDEIARGTVTQFEMRFPAGILPGKYTLRFKHLAGWYRGSIEEHEVNLAPAR